MECQTQDRTWYTLDIIDDQQLDLRGRLNVIVPENLLRERHESVGSQTGIGSMLDE